MARSPTDILRDLAIHIEFGRVEWGDTPSDKARGRLCELIAEAFEVFDPGGSIWADLIAAIEAGCSSGGPDGARCTLLEGHANLHVDDELGVTWGPT